MPMHDSRIPEQLAPRWGFWIGMLNAVLIVGAIGVLVWLLW